MVAAFSCLAAANVLPAFRYGGDTMYGWQASWLEFLAVPMGHEDWPAAVLGMIANLGFLATFIAARAGRSKLAKRIAVTAAASAFGSVGLLALGANLGHFVPYPGCVLWLATGVLLACATRRLSAAEVAPDGPDPAATGTDRRTASTAIRMDGEMLRKIKTATGVELTVVNVVLGLGAIYLLGFGVFCLFNRPMDVTAFEVRLQRELQTKSGWSGIRAYYSPIPWPATRPNYDIVFVTARKNNRIVETSLYKSEMYKLSYLYIDASYHYDLPKKSIRVEYNGSSVVKVVESVPFANPPPRRHAESDGSDGSGDPFGKWDKFQ